MLNPHLTNVVIASLKAAGIKAPDLSPIRPFPQPRATMEELTEVLISSEYENPYEDPKAVALAAQLYIKSLGRLDQGHYQRERERRAAELESHKDELLQQLQDAFNTTAKSLIKHAEPIKGVEHPASIDVRTDGRGPALAATNVLQELMALENIIKAWSDLWLALGNASYGVDRGKPFTFMIPNAQQWEHMRDNRTIWEAVRNGVPLTLADSPELVSARYQAMINNEQAALEARRESKHVSYLPEGGYPQWVKG